MGANGEPGSGRGNIVRINIVLAVVDALLLAAVVALFVMPGGGLDLIFGPPADEPVEQQPVAEPEPEPEPEPAAEAEPEEEPAAEPEPEPEPADPVVVPAEREQTGTHSVRAGDTFYDIAGEYWGDEHLWPDLYSLNAGRFADPDLIRPGDVVAVYPALDSDGELSRSDTGVLSEAYLETYRAYRAIGLEALERGRASGSRYWIERSRNKINKAHWLLYSGHRFNPDLVDEYADGIDPRDLRVVRGYLERFGYPDP